MSWNKPWKVTIREIKAFTIKQTKTHTLETLIWHKQCMSWRKHTKAPHKFKPSLIPQNKAPLLFFRQKTFCTHWPHPSCSHTYINRIENDRHWSDNTCCHVDKLRMSDFLPGGHVGVGSVTVVSHWWLWEHRYYTRLHAMEVSAERTKRAETESACRDVAFHGHPLLTEAGKRRKRAFSNWGIFSGLVARSMD